MYDDNVTPRWALLWSHGIPITHHPSKRTFAHVWEVADSMEAFNHLANIIMVPEPFAGLTDKTGPLTEYLRWHAFGVYGWKPENAEVPTKPNDFDEIEWRYLPKIEDPKQFVSVQVRRLNNQRIKILRPIMEQRGML